MTTPPSSNTGPPQPCAARGRLLVDGRLVPGAVIFARRQDPRAAPGRRHPDLALAGERRRRGGRHAGAHRHAGERGLRVRGGGQPESLRQLAARLPATGVTAFLPTLVSASSARYRTAFAAFEEANRAAAGAVPLGLHLEGPFIAATRAGAHARAAIEAAEPAVFDEAAARGILRLVTLAPERSGAPALIRRLHERGVLVSLGHTDASFEELTAGIDAGARMVTHLYNAMSPFGHRAAGAVGAALTDARVVAGVIADGVHVAAPALRLARAAKGPLGLVLVTDAVAAAGLGPGRFELGGQAIISDGVMARLADDTAGVTLAGSTLTLDQAVRTFARLTAAPMEEALQMATLVPARLLGLTGKGRLIPGADADLVLWSDTWQIEATFFGRGGVHQAAPSPGQ